MMMDSDYRERMEDLIWKGVVFLFYMIAMGFAGMILWLFSD